MGKWPYWAEFFQLGWVVALSLLIPLAVGLWLDRRMGTMPLFLIIGMLVGTLSATVGTVRMAMRMMREMDARQGEKKSRRGPPPGDCPPAGPESGLLA
ncbi:MAG: AtpZ/AtpI family protein [Anaerolineae bacterium]|mgnify:CR=1 FL=1